MPARRPKDEEWVSKLTEEERLGPLMTQRVRFNWFYPLAFVMAFSLDRTITNVFPTTTDSSLVLVILLFAAYRLADILAPPQPIAEQAAQEEPSKSGDGGRDD